MADHQSYDFNLSVGIQELLDVDSAAKVESQIKKQKQELEEPVEIKIKLDANDAKKRIKELRESMITAAKSMQKIISKKNGFSKGDYDKISQYNSSLKKDKREMEQLTEQLKSQGVVVRNNTKDAKALKAVLEDIGFIEKKQQKPSSQKKKITEDAKKAVVPEESVSVATEQEKAAKRAAKATEAVGEAASQAAKEVKRSQEQIQKDIEDTNRLIKNQKEWINYLDPAINKDHFKTKGKKEATDQLRMATSRYTSYYQNQTEQNAIYQYAEEMVNVAWMHAYQEAERQGVAQSVLNRYRTSTGDSEYKKYFAELQDEYERRANLIVKKEEELAKLKAELSSSQGKSITPNIQENSKSTALSSKSYELDKLEKKLAKAEQTVLDFNATINSLQDDLTKLNSGTQIVDTVSIEESKKIATQGIKQAKKELAAAEKDRDKLVSQINEIKTKQAVQVHTSDEHSITEDKSTEKIKEHTSAVKADTDAQKENAAAAEQAVKTKQKASKIKLREFTQEEYDKLDGTDQQYVYETVDMLRSASKFGTKFSADLTTSCKNATTAVKRFFSAIDLEKYPQYTGWKDSILESISNGAFSDISTTSANVQTGEYAWGVEESGNGWYVYLNVLDVAEDKQEAFTASLEAEVKKQEDAMQRQGQILIELNQKWNQFSDLRKTKPDEDTSGYDDLISYYEKESALLQDMINLKKELKSLPLLTTNRREASYIDVSDDALNNSVFHLDWFKKEQKKEEAQLSSQDKTWQRIASHSEDFQNNIELIRSDMQSLTKEDVSLFNEEQLKAAVEYCKMIQKDLTGTFNISKALSNAMELVGDISDKNISSLINRFAGGDNEAANKALKMLTGMPTGTKKNRDKAIRSIDVDEYDRLMKEQEKAQEKFESKRAKQKPIQLFETPQIETPSGQASQLAMFKGMKVSANEAEEAIEDLSGAVQEVKQVAGQISFDEFKNLAYHAGVLSDIEHTAKSSPLGNVDPFKRERTLGLTGLYVTEKVAGSDGFEGNEWEGAPISTIDLSHYKLFNATTNEISERLSAFLSNVNGVIYGYLDVADGFGKLTRTTDLPSLESLYAEMNGLFGDVNVTFDQFVNLIQEGRAIVKGHSFTDLELPDIDQGVAKSAINKALQGVSGDVFNSDSFPTRLLKMLGFEGVDRRGTGYNGTYTGGSIVFDIKPESLVKIDEKWTDFMGRMGREIDKEDLEYEQKRSKIAYDTAGIYNRQKGVGQAKEQLAVEQNITEEKKEQAAIQTKEPDRTVTQAIGQYIDNYDRELDKLNNELMQGTQLLNEQNKVITLFHNSAEAFDKFDPSKISESNLLGRGHYLSTSPTEFGRGYGATQTQWYANVSKIFDANKDNSFSVGEANKIINTYCTDAIDTFGQKMLQEMTTGSGLSAVYQIAEAYSVDIADIFQAAGYEAARVNSEINVFDPSKLHRANDITMRTDAVDFKEFYRVSDELSAARMLLQEYKQGGSQELISQQNAVVSRLESELESLQHKINSTASGVVLAAGALEEVTQAEHEVASASKEAEKGIEAHSDALNEQAEEAKKSIEPQKESKLTTAEHQAIFGSGKIEKVLDDFNITGQDRTVVGDLFREMGQSAKQLADAYSNPDVDNETYERAAKDMATKVMSVTSALSEFGTQVVGTQDDLKAVGEYLSGKKIRYTNEDKSEFGDSWSSVSKRFNNVLTKGTKGIDDELSDMFPHFFSKDIINKNEQLNRILNVIGLYREAKKDQFKIKEPIGTKNEIQSVVTQIGKEMVNAVINITKKKDIDVKPDQSKKPKQDVSATDIVQKQIDRALKQLRSAKNNETTLFSLKDVFDGDNLVDQAYAMVKNIADSADLSLGKFTAKDDTIKVQMYNEALKVTVDQTYKLRGATEDTAAALELVSESYSQNVKALNTSNFDVEGMQARATAAVEKVRSSLHGLEYDLADLENASKNIHSKEDWDKFNNQLKATQDNIQALKNATVSKNSLNQLANMQRDMKNASIDIETMRLKLQKLDNVEGTKDASDIIDKMTAAVKRFNDATDADSQQASYNEYSNLRSQFNSQMQYLNVKKSSETSSTNTEKKNIEEYYNDILKTVKKINDLGVRIDKLKFEDGGTGIYTNIINQLEFEKSTLLGHLDQIGDDIRGHFEGIFEFGDTKTDLPSGTFLDMLQNKGGIADFFNDINVQDVLGADNIGKFTNAMKKSVMHDLEVQAKVGKIIAQAKETIQQTKVMDLDGFDQNNEKVKQYRQSLENLALVYQLLNNTDQSQWTSEMIGNLQSATNAVKAYGKELMNSFAKEQTYFSNMHKVSTGETYDDDGTKPPTSGSTEIAVRDGDGFKDARQRLAEYVAEFSKGKGIITDFATAANGISEMKFSMFDDDGKLRTYTVALGQFTDQIYRTENSIQNLTTGTAAIDKVAKTIESLISSLAGVDGAHGYVQQLVEMLNRIHILKNAGDSKDIGSQNKMLNYAAEYGIRIKEIVAAQKEWAKAQADIESGLAEPLGTIDKSGNIEAQMQGLIESSVSAKINVQSFDDATNTLTYTFTDASGAIKTMVAHMHTLNGVVVQSEGQTGKLKNAWQELAGAFGDVKGYAFRYIANMIDVGSMIQAMKQGFQTVKEIDIALTEVKKVTDETDASYRMFLEDMSKTGAVVGSTVKDLTTSAADWARIGYSLEEAGKLASNTMVLMNVSEFENVADATDSMISAIQAFKDQADTDDIGQFSMDIIDIFNQIGNSYAISTSDLADSLTRSSASLVAANNSLEEAVALTTAGNTITQNPEVVGSTLKTLAMRIRGVKSELEEAGEDTEGMITNTSKLQAKVQALTNVDGKGGIDILTESGEFRSTYDILLSISRVWAQMNDMDQAECCLYVQKCA